MGIAKVTEDWTGASIEISLNRDTQRIEGSGVRAFDVDFTEGDTSFKPLTALYAPGIPVPWDCIPGFPWSYVTGYGTPRMTGPLSVKVIVNYKIYEDPLAIPPIIRWDFATDSDILDLALEPGSTPENPVLKAVLNSSGEQPDPPMMKEYHDLLLSVTVNRPTFDHILASQYIDAVNSDMFFGFRPGLVKCRKMSGTQLRAAGLVYWQHDYEFQIRTFYSDPAKIYWFRRFLDQGYHEVVLLSNGKYEVRAFGDWLIELEHDITSPNYGLEAKRTFKPVAKPVRLDGHGLQLAENLPDVYIEIQDFQYRPFSVLGLE